MASFRVRNDCRLCGTGDLRQLLELTPTPPANEYMSSSAASISDNRFPLGLWGCTSCGHVQLPVVVDPERLFRDYKYVSGTSPSFVDHFRRYAGSIIQELGIPRGSRVVDVGSNDGTFLRFFQEAGMDVLGIDPAVDIARKATNSGIKTVSEFFNSSLSRRLAEQWGPAALITANNVFAHTDDRKSLAYAVRDLMASDGVFVFEVQYLVDMCRGGLFDMVYHEHLSYHHIGPLVPFLEFVGLHLFDVERVPTHGGSIRCFADSGSRPISHRVDELRKMEHSMNLVVPGWPGEECDGIDPVVEMRIRIEGLKDILLSKLRAIKEAGGRIAAYGAPAKATTLVHHFGLVEGFLDYVVDDNPLKQGRFIPGTGIPICEPDRLKSDVPEYLLILAWNFAEQITVKCCSFLEKGGKILIPLPEFKEI